MNPTGQLVIFETENRSVEVRLEGEALELQEAATTEDFSVVRLEGLRRVRTAL